MIKPVLGAQLYTVRSSMKTLPEIVETLRKIAKIGYTTVQLSGLGPVDPKELAKVIRDSGLKCVATHIGWQRFLTDLDAVIEEHKLWGCAHAAIGGLPPEYFSSKDGVKRFIDELMPVSARLEKADMDFSYHNHHHELTRYDGKTWLETLYENTDPRYLKAEIDVYWIQAGGSDPAEWIKKCTGREPLVHLKDMCVTQAREVRMAEIGNGNLNWPGILKAAEEGDVQYMLVEQDNCYERDPFEALAISYNYLRRMGYN